MRIKRLSIYGFKSFPEEVRLDFHRGITVIVGPNGSGKTNIFDAIRWIFGDQSPSNLRCEKIEDLIFFGSSQRRSAGFTEVKLILENEGELPEFGPEIEITRRFYRSQESDFYINRSPCRLKDIQDLALRIGGLSYAFLESGKIKEIIRGNIKRMFDESAGIARYYEQREEALRRIKRGEEELRRLNDLIEEMVRNVRSLKRQANKVMRRKRLEELKAKAEVKGALRRLREVEKEYQKLKGELRSLKKEGVRLTRKIAERKERLNLVEELIASYGDKLARKKALSWEKERLEEERERLKDELPQLESELSNLEGRLADQERLGRRLNQLIHLGREQLTELNREIEALDEKLAQLIEQRQAVTTDQSDVLAELRSGEFMRQRLRKEIGRLEGEALGLGQDIAQLEGECGRLEMELDGLRRKEKILVEEHERLKEMEASIEKKMMEVRREEIEISGMIESLRTQLRESKRDYYRRRFQKKFVGMVHELIKPKAGYEKAIDAVLGPVQDYAVVVDLDPADLIKLAGDEIGIILSSPDLIHKRTKTIYGDYPQALGFLFEGIDFLKTPPKSITAPVATKSGLFITKQLVRSSTSGRLEIKSRLKELKQQQNDLAGQLARYQHEAERIGREKGERGKELRSIQKKIEEKRDGLYRLVKKLEIKKSHHNSIASQIAKLQRELVEVEKRCNEVSSVVAKGSSNLQDLNQEIGRLRELISEKRKQRQANQTELERLRLEYARIQIDQEADRMKRETVVRKLKECKDRGDEIELRLVEVEAGIAEIGPIPEEAWEEGGKLRRMIEQDEEKRRDVEQRAYQLQLECYKREEMIRELKEKVAGSDDSILDDDSVPDIEEIEEKIAQIGMVNPLSITQYEEEKSRLEGFLAQKEDVEAAIIRLKRSVRESDQNAINRLIEKIQAVNLEFGLVFESVFGGGSGKVRLVDPDHPLESPVEIVAALEGKRIKRLSQLSGGEQSLLALTLLFAFYRVNPAPFLILDEVDAPLDDSNIQRLCGFLKELAQKIQIIIITHNPLTIRIGDYLYGVTMEEPGVSKVVAVDFRDAARIME